MDKARILVDVDGVIYNFVDAFMERYEKNGGLVPEGFEWTHWDSMDNLPDQFTVDHVWQRDLNLFYVGKPYPGAVEALEKLNGMYDVRIVTATPHRHIPARSDWFADNLPFVHRKNQMVFTNDKSIIDGDFLIDDHLPHIRAWEAAGKPNGVIIDRPWNQVDRWDEVGTRVFGLVDFCTRIGIGGPCDLEKG